MKNVFRESILPIIFGISLTVSAQDNGGINPTMMQEIRSSFKNTAEEKAIRNAIGGTDLKKLAINQENQKGMDTYFSHRVPTKGISDQKSSGRCWLFTGLNVLRSRMIAQNDLGPFEFSQNYLFFYDQLEKSNLFLQGIIDTRDLPMDNQTVNWLFQHPLSDGGQFTGVADLIKKYGVVPQEVMPETNSSNKTSMMSQLIATKLREFGLELRETTKKEKKEEIIAQKAEMLKIVYRMLALNLGEPPTEFSWTMKRNNKSIHTKQYTPQSFYETYIGKSVVESYVMIMNDPTREFYKLYEIDYDRHVYDGVNWTYLNLPIEEVKEIAIASIKDSTMLYYSCDVGKYLDSERGLLDVNNYDYESLLGVKFGMDKKQRIATYASGSSHAMTLCAVDLDENGNAKKWMVENSWGASNGYQGHLIMTDEWFKEYTFRIVAERKYLSEKTIKLLNQKAIKLPAWDPMFSSEE